MATQPHNSLRRVRQILSEMHFDCQGDDFSSTNPKTVTWHIFAKFAPINIGVSFHLNARTKTFEAQWFIRVYARYFFESDRSDANDIIASTLGLYFRNVFNQSFAFMEEEHGFVPGEIDAIWLTPSQPIPAGVCLGPNACDEFISVALRIQHYWRAFYGLVFYDGSPISDRSSYPGDDAELAHWALQISNCLRTTLTDEHTSASRRINPDWWYFRNARRGVTVARAPKFAALWRYPNVPKLRELTSETGTFMMSGDAKNFVLKRDVLKAKRLLRSISDSAANEPVVMPMENRLAVVGGEHIVLLYRNCGRHAWEKEREKSRGRYEAESVLLFPPLRFVWRTRIDDSEFEQLVHVLLTLHPGVERVRSAGPTRQADGGRDLIVQWRRPDSGGSGTDGPGSRLKTFIVQCKACERAISKSDVPDLRDTLEHFQAEGYLLVASSRLSAGCIAHLERLGTRYDVDWWTRTELEQLLAKHPELSDRFRGVFRTSGRRNGD